MKKIILVVAVILISTNTLHATKFNWTDRMKTKDGYSEFYIDKNSIKKIDNYVYYWSLANYLKYEEGESTGIKSVIVFNRIDCNDMGYQIIIMSMYGDYMGRGEILTHFLDPDTEEEKRFDSKTSVAYGRHEKLCN
ncbi:hypothetical protein N9S92_01365 [Candidatus Pelagibacter sp.]|nr:hypothetical protein [Candidatus Pelagibacter sp.]